MRADDLLVRLATCCSPTSQLVPTNMPLISKLLPQADGAACRAAEVSRDTQAGRRAPTRGSAARQGIRKRMNSASTIMDSALKMIDSVFKCDESLKAGLLLAIYETEDSNSPIRTDLLPDGAISIAFDCFSTVLRLFCDCFATVLRLFCDCFAIKLGRF